MLLKFAAVLSVAFLAQSVQADSLFKMRQDAPITGEAGVGGGDSGVQLRASVNTELDTGTKVEGIVEGGFPLLRIRGRAEHQIPLAVAEKKLNNDGTLEISLVPLSVAGKAVMTVLNPEDSPARQQLMITPQAIARLAYNHRNGITAAAIRFRVGPTVGVGSDGDGAGLVMGANSGLDLTASINLGAIDDLGNDRFGDKNTVASAAERYCYEKAKNNDGMNFTDCQKEQIARRSADKIALDLTYSVDHLQSAIGNVDSGLHSQSVNIGVRRTKINQGVNAIGFKFVGDRFDVNGDLGDRDDGIAHGFYFNASGVW